MRHTVRALLSVMLVIGCCQSLLAETSGWHLWPFGGNEEPAVKAAAPTTTAPKFTPSPSLPPSPDITPIGPESPPPRSAAQQSTTTQYPSESELPKAQKPVVAKSADRPPLVESPFPKMKWPTMKMPDWSPSKSHSAQAASNLPHADNPERNAWVEKAPEPPKPSAMQSVKNSAHRVADSTRNAWHKTVAAITPGDEDHRTGARIASRDIKPPFWQKMMGTEPEKREEQTISGFVGQPRP